MISQRYVYNDNVQWTITIDHKQVMHIYRYECTTNQLNDFPSLLQLLGGGDIYHFSCKLMLKEPKTGGAHLWHQDYG